MSRVPGTYRNRGPVLMVLPNIPDDAPDAIKNGLAIRNACATEGRCPACGAEPVLEFVAERVYMQTWHHEDGCPVLLDNEVDA